MGSLDVELRQTDAGTTDAYERAVPADPVLLCGIFGNVSDADVEGTIAAAPSFCRPGALVLWTRHRKEPDLTPRIRGWFASPGFLEEDFITPAHGIWSVGAHRFRGSPQPLVPGQRLFTFVR